MRAIRSSTAVLQPQPTKRCICQYFYELNGREVYVRGEKVEPCYQKVKCLGIQKARRGLVRPDCLMQHSRVE